MLINAINSSLDEIIAVLHQISDDQYTNECSELSGATIGEHTRHIIEMFQCLENQYESGIVNYDNRKRNKLVQNNVSCAAAEIEKIKTNLVNPNKNILIKQVVNGEEISIESNFHRELLYNLEHCIHHQALIKVAILKTVNIKLNPNFGIAPSTIEYRKQCVQ